VKNYLSEHLSFDQAGLVLESSEEGDKKTLHLNGICIQGDIRNANQRIYPSSEIAKAVKTINEQIGGGYSCLGEVDHPADLRINLDRVSHMITKMWMEGPNGYGKLKLLPTPMGQLVQTMLESGVKLGVSSRGSGNVAEDGSGKVSDFEIITVDIVAQPSAPGAYPTPVYEHLMNTVGGYKAFNIAREVQGDPKAQKYIAEGLMRIIKGLK
jgi:Prohead core protein serine protease